MQHLEINFDSVLTESNDASVFFSLLNAPNRDYDWRAIGPGGITSFRGSLEDHRKKLNALNKAGYDIFVTINETDGKDIKGANITRVRALFADFDGSPLSNLDRISLKPSFTVNTSPDRYHAYWLIDDCPLDQFKMMQQKLAYILESDPAVCDLGRIMRVPGFYHLKGDPFMVTIDCPERAKRYSFSEVKKAISSLTPINEVTARHSLKIGCIEGSRNTALTSLAGRLIYDCQPDTLAIQALMDWNTLNTPPLPDEEIISTYHRIKAKDEAEHGESRHILKQLNDNHAVVMIGGKAVIVKEGKKPIFMTYNDFCLRYAHLKIDGKKATKIWIESDDTRRYDELVFDPSGRCPSTSYNLFKGLSVEPVAGKCDLYLRHVKEIICAGDQALYDYVMGWMAHAIQKPTELPGVALVLRGSQGTGKGTFAQHFGKIFGDHFQHLVHMDHLLGKFNAHLSSALVVFADEIVWGGNKREAGQLKGIISESRRMMEAKFKDPILVDNYARFIFATNDEWAVPTGPKERRYCVLNVDESKAENHIYFDAINTEMRNGGLEALMHTLMNFDLSQFNVRRYPVTEGLLEQKQLSLPSVAQWWYDILIEGDNQISLEKHIPPTAVIGTSTPTTALFEIYQAFAKGDRYGHGQVASCRLFVTTLRNWVPIVKDRVTDNGKRGRRQVIPDLETCRDHFEKAIGHEIDWDAT
ncbi:DUF5906 domain-containing protein [Porticoccaceae bacterium]|nr:DUF5906 domain-containing protein [Porticoccaceae bacterium]